MSSCLLETWAFSQHHPTSLSYPTEITVSLNIPLPPVFSRHLLYQSLGMWVNLQRPLASGVLLSGWEGQWTWQQGLKQPIQTTKEAQVLRTVKPQGMGLGPQTVRPTRLFCWLQVFLGDVQLSTLLSHVNMATGNPSPRTSSPMVCGALGLLPVLGARFLALGFLFRGSCSQVAGAHSLGASTHI